MTGIDSPKSLADQNTRYLRTQALEQPRSVALKRYVDELRTRMGGSYHVPHFDPLDGGVEARYLFLLEAPGPNAVKSGFVSRDNPDETAKNLFLLSREAGIRREHTALWNIVPWYVGSGVKIRPVTRRDIKMAIPHLAELIAHFTQLKAVVLVGRKAASARVKLQALVPGIDLFEMPHPSPMFVNRSPANRDAVLSALQLVSKGLAGGVP